MSHQSLPLLFYQVVQVREGPDLFDEEVDKGSESYEVRKYLKWSRIRKILYL